MTHSTCVKDTGALRTCGGHCEVLQQPFWGICVGRGPFCLPPRRTSPHELSRRVRMLYRGHTHLPAMFCKHFRRWTAVCHQCKATRASVHLDDKPPTHSVVMLIPHILCSQFVLCTGNLHLQEDHDPCRRLCTLPTTTEHGCVFRRSLQSQTELQHCVHTGRQNPAARHGKAGALCSTCTSGTGVCRRSRRAGR